MIELPEALTLAKQLSDTVTGKKISRVFPPTKPHKFCWFNGDAAEYEDKIKGACVTGARGFGIYVELMLDNGCRLCVNDGVNIRLVSGDIPKDYQLLIVFEGGDALALTVAMYGGIILHAGDYDNEYYLKSRAYVSPFAPEFEAHFYHTLSACKPTASAKAFLATEQRFPGIGNGVVQDILFAAGIHPKRKVATFDEADKKRLLDCVVSVLRDMVAKGGRDTEKDAFGNGGGYTTKMSKLTLGGGCPACGGSITKEPYLGGSVYYCPACQVLKK